MSHTNITVRVSDRMPKCGFCSWPATTVLDPDKPHGHCPIGILNGDGTTVLRCACTCTAGLIKCFGCGRIEKGPELASLTHDERGKELTKEQIAEVRAERAELLAAHEGEINPETWYCFDEDACAASIEAKLAANPTIQMIRSLQANAEVRVQAERRVGSSRPSSGECLHCGEPTKGGLFLPGHDASFLSSAIKTISAREATLQEVLDGWAELGISEALRGKLSKRVVA